MRTVCHDERLVEIVLCCLGSYLGHLQRVPRFAGHELCPVNDSSSEASGDADPSCTITATVKQQPSILRRRCAVRVDCRQQQAALNQLFHDVTPVSTSRNVERICSCAETWLSCVDTLTHVLAITARHRNTHDSGSGVVPTSRACAGERYSVVPRGANSWSTVCACRYYPYDMRSFPAAAGICFEPHPALCLL